MTLFLRIDKTITKQFTLSKKDFFSSETDVIRGSVGENNENFIVAKFVKSGVNSYMSSTQQKKKYLQIQRSSDRFADTSLSS